MSEPTAVIGLPVLNGERHLAEALESLLTQTRSDLAVVVVDNASTDATAEIAAAYAELGVAPIAYTRNERTIGLADNWRVAFDLAGEHHPDAPYFAWGSDHDVWHPRWLELLVAELEAHPEAALAYPASVRVDDAGAEYPSRGNGFETAGVADPEERLRLAARRMTGTGDLVYGLFRRAALERCGPFPRAVLPDRLQLLRLALEGEFRHVPQRAWSRRYPVGVVMTNARQRRTSFPEGVPLRAYLPWSLTHAASFGAGRLGRVVLRESVLHAVERARRRGERRRRWKRRERRQRLRALLGRPAPPAQSAPPENRQELDPVVLAEVGAPDATFGVDLFAEHPDELARRLYERGVPELYVVERESPALREAVGRWYWLRDVWVGGEGQGRKPDPTTGPVPRSEGSYRHLVGRRRLIPRG
jgi:glycosyltransferase involved in cell wall biosynthesis